MTSLLVNKSTMTDQVTAHLEHAIITGELKPLARLKSTRELAKAYGVSQRVVLFALDRLEEKKLVRRKERAGVFVSELASDPTVSEVLIFVFGDNPERNPFVHKICNVVSSSAARGNFDFFTRYITLTYERLCDQEYMKRRLDSEISRLSKQFTPDIALILGPRFEHSDVEKCLELPFPTLFIGDFEEGDFPDLTYNRLGFAQDFYNLPLTWAKEKKLKRIAFMISSKFENDKYSAVAIKNMQQLAAKSGLETVVIGVKDTHASDPGMQKAGITLAAETFKQQGGADVLVLDGIYQQEFLMNNLVINGFKPLTQDLEVISYQHDSQIPGMKYKQITPAGNTALHQRICDVINELLAGKQTGFREQYSMIEEIR